MMGMKQEILLLICHLQVRGKMKEFILGIGWWMAVAIPATYTNSMVCLDIFLYVPCSVKAN